MRISVCNSLTKGCLDFIQLIVRYYSKFHLKEWIYEKEEFITRFLEIELKGTLFCILNLSGNPVKERNAKSTCVDKRNNRENAGPIATFPGSDFHLKENTEGLAFKRRATAGHGTICFTRFRQAPSIFCTFHSAAKVWTTTGLHRVISRLTLSSHDVNNRKMETVMALNEENRIRR